MDKSGKKKADLLKEIGLLVFGSPSQTAVGTGKKHSQYNDL